MEFPVLWSGLCPLYCAYCGMLGDISCISYYTNPRVKKTDVCMLGRRQRMPMLCVWWPPLNLATVPSSLCHLVFHWPSPYHFRASLFHFLQGSISWLPRRRFSQHKELFWLPKSQLLVYKFHFFNMLFFVLLEIQIVCRPDYIEVTLQKSDFPGLIVNDSVLHLEDEACVASYKDDSMVKFTFGLEACNTEQEDDGEKIYYKNKVYLKAGQPSEDDAITREHTEIIPFKCGYEKKATISKVSYDPRTTLVVTDAGNLENLMQLRVREKHTRSFWLVYYINGNWWPTNRLPACTN